MFKNRPNWLNSYNMIPYESGYLFYNYDYSKSLIVPFNSGTLQQGWVSSVPLASSIESTMEWLDRTAKDQFIPYGLDGSLISTGFEWNRHNGKILESFVPDIGCSGLLGYPWHASGTWTKFRENLDYTQKRMLLGPRSDSKTFATTDDNYILNNYFDGIQTVANQIAQPKLANRFYHNFIPNVYKSVPYFTGFNIVIASSCEVPQGTPANPFNFIHNGKIREYDENIMHSSYLGLVGNRNYSVNISEGISRNGELPYLQGFYNSNIDISGLVHYHSLTNLMDSPILLGSGQINKTHHTVLPFRNFSFLGNLVDSRYSSDTYLGYYTSAPPYILLVSGTYTGYYVNRIAGISAFVYPVSFSGLKNVAINTHMVYPTHSLNGDSPSYPFHSITGISGINVNCFFNHYDGLLDESLYFETGSSGLLTFLGNHYQNLECDELETNLKFVYGFVGHGNLYQNIATKLINLDYIELSHTIIPIRELERCIPGLKTQLPDFASGVNYEHFSVDVPDGITDVLYSVCPSSHQYCMSADISQALVAIPPTNSEFLFFAFFESPIFGNSTYAPPVITPTYSYPPLISGVGPGGTLECAVLRHHESVQPSLFQITSNYNVSGVHGTIWGVAGDTAMDVVYRRRYNIGFQGKGNFDMDYYNYGYSSKVTPGYLSNGPISGLITNSLNGVSFSGIIPTHDYFYGF